MKLIRGIVIFGLVLGTLAACTPPGQIQSFKPICNALGANADKSKPGPIRYNTFRPNSRRHAGPDLAADLKTRNQVGHGIGCW